MNQPPSRHPLFVAIACIALAGAWSTGAYEAETGESMALVSMAVSDAPSPQRLGSDCPGPRGPTRALCLFEASRPSSPIERSAITSPPQRTDVTVAPAVRVAAR